MPVVAILAKEVAVAGKVLSNLGVQRRLQEFSPSLLAPQATQRHEIARKAANLKAALEHGHEA
jgi:hypothetical protein